MEKRTADIITYVSLAVIVISLAFIGTKITGRATGIDTGIVNISIESSASINFSVDTINFGSGIANDSNNPAILETNGSGVILNGNWTLVSKGLNITNIGNGRLQVNLTSNVTADNFIGGSDPEFFFMIDNSTACPNANYSLAEGVWGNFSTANVGQNICADLDYHSNNDTIVVDIHLKISTDALPGTRQALITATGTSI